MAMPVHAVPTPEPTPVLGPGPLPGSGSGSGPRPPAVAPLELSRLRGAVRAGLFGASTEAPRVGRYALSRCIGHGGMGIVYAATDVELDREVAIKLLRPELSAHDDERLTSEARALARLSHPNVVSVFDVGTYEGQRFIAMEYVPGQDLRRWLDAPRELRDLLSVFVAAGRGLQAAHEVGLVHRDFKPDNVLVGDDGRPRVLDFGLARPPDGAPAPAPKLGPNVDPLATVLTQAGQVVGTPAYMAPEQHLGEPADARSDQFSFAVSLYHAVYGVRPFSGDDPQALALSIVRGKVRPATPRYPVPPWLDALLSRALSVDPAQRFESMKALLDRIVAKLDAQPPSPDLAALPHRGVVEDLAFAATARSDASALLPAVMPAPAAVAPVPSAAAAGAVATRALPSEGDGAIVTSLSTRRTLDHRVDGETLGLLARELNRLERRRGRVERLGASMTWTTKQLEVHADVSPRGTELLVWRRLDRALARRTAGWMAFGFWLASLFIGMVAGSGVLDANEGLIPIVVIGSLVGGATMGYRKARARHIRALPSMREQLEFIADRLVGVAHSQPALTAGDFE